MQALQGRPRHRVWVGALEHDAEGSHCSYTARVRWNCGLQRVQPWQNRGILGAIVPKSGRIRRSGILQRAKREAELQNVFSILPFVNKVVRQVVYQEPAEAPFGHFVWVIGIVAQLANR